MGPLAFSRLCHSLAAVLLLGVLPLLAWFNPQALPPGIKPDSWHADFAQYYIGAVGVRHGLWNEIYATPRMALYDGPPTLQPVHPNAFYEAAKARRDRSLYPLVNLPIGSDYAPEILAFAPQGRDHFRYVCTPPAALFFAPLAWFSYDTAANCVWPTLSLIAFFFAIVFATRTLRVLHGGVSHAEGWTVLLCLVVVALGPNSIPDGNVTPLLSVAISGAVYALARRRLDAFSLAFIFMVVTKGIGLMWLPLLLDRPYRRSIVYLATLSILLNGIVVALAGVSVYHQFFALLPLLNNPTGQGLVPTLVQLFGFYPKTLFLVFNLGVLATLYFGYWRRRQPDAEAASTHAAVLLPLLGGTMALYCLTNPSVWWHYVPDYLVVPFSGWLMFELLRSRGLARGGLSAGVAVTLSLMTLGWRDDSALGAMLHRPAMVIVPLIFLAVAIRALYARADYRGR